MSKNKTAYVCNDCGSEASKWAGQCSDCGAWNTMTQIVIAKTESRYKNYSGSSAAEIIKLPDVKTSDQSRLSTNLVELDRVLGGGLVAGSVVLVGGDPGIGKSTVLLQALANLSQDYTCLYVTGEESLEQVKLRAKRLNLSSANIELLTETNIESIIKLTERHKPSVMVLDSIQTIHTDMVAQAPGTVTQVREVAANIVRFAKQLGIAVFLVGHVTKDGSIAGPKILEHMVDTVLYFEGETSGRFRLLRAVKNRFGAVNELGIFAMTDTGLKEVNNPSAIFLSRAQESVCGSVVMVAWEGSRPLLIEVQALVDESPLGNPRRVTVGLEQNRLALILAVLNRHCGILTYNQDVFVNVVGGVKVNETGIDLAALLAVLSSLKNKPVPHDLVVFGEVGLSGEIRPVQNGQERLKEAEKLGFTKAIIPTANLPKKDLDKLQVTGINKIENILSIL